MKKNSITAIILAAILLLSVCKFTARTISAHVIGKSFEQVVDTYKVDVGYDVNTFALNQPVSFDFDVFDNKTGNEIPFTDIWVRLVRDGQTVFATGIHRPQLGRASMVYVFPEAGSYELHVRFENPDKAVVETTILLKVDATGAKLVSSSLLTELAFGVSGIIIGVALFYAISKLKKHV